MAEREGFELFCASQTFASANAKAAKQGKLKQPQAVFALQVLILPKSIILHSPDTRPGRRRMAEREGFEPSRGLSPP